MSDQTRRTPASSRPVADLRDLEVDTYEKTDDEPVFRLRLLVERADPIEFRKKAEWDLLIGRDDLEQIARKILAALEE